MSRTRPLLLLTLLASSTALAGFAYADPVVGEASDVGGWGQAWGDEVPPPASASALPRRATAVSPSYVPPPAAAALPTRVSERSASSVTPASVPVQVDGEAYPEVGGWGQAWGEDEAPPPPRPRSTPSSTISNTPSPVPSARPTVASASSAVAQPQEGVASFGRVGRNVVASIMPEDRGEDGDAVGIKRPPRIIPRAVQSANRRTEGEDPPVHMVADEIIYDREYNIVTAKGRVEMIQSGRTIAADTVSYNLKQDVMGASGHVAMTEPTGEVTYADYFELTGDFKNGVASQIRMILADNSRLAAQAGQRVGGDRTDFDRAVYTACEPCRDNPDATPIWQAKAARITHNQAEAQIEYRDAWVELAGVPVMYTPYLSHPDPTVKRKSGFLAPTIGYGSTLGASVATPYFFVLSDYEDFTLTPRFMAPTTTSALSSAPSGDEIVTTAMKHVLINGEHRWRGVYGEAKTQASITADQSSGNIRGNIDSKGIVELDRVWRAGWQVQNQSDETYRQLYRIRTDTDRPWLLTRPYVEGFGRSNYAMAETLSFQGHHLEADPSKSPVVAPHLVMQNVSNAGWGGSYWTFDSDFMSFMRSQGTEGQRLSHRTAWNLPLRSPDGQVVLVSASMRGDGYRATHLDTVPSGASSVGRAIPELSVDWRYPFVRTSASLSQVIEPMVMVATAPVGGNSGKIPNEDSLAFELDETNVMRPNRLVGLDRVETGTRGGYGLRWAAYPSRGGMASIQAAQGWRQHTDSTFGDSSGFTSTFSDYLGRVDVRPAAYVALVDRVRLDKTTLEVRRNEATVAIGPPPLSFSTSYVFLSSTSASGMSFYPRRQYLAYSLSSQWSRYWNAAFSLNQDLASNGGVVGWNGRVMYNDECFAVVGSMNRFFSDNPGLLSGYNLMLTVVLKTLGEAPISVF